MLKLTEILRTTAAHGLLALKSAFCVIAIFFAISATVYAADCRITGQACVEGPETRNIAGNMIYKECWRYRSTYECIKPDSVDYCAAISKVAGCYQT